MAGPQTVSKEEMIHKITQQTLECFGAEKVKPLPDLPKGIEVADLPPIARGLYEMKQGKFPNGEFTKIIKV